MMGRVINIGGTEEQQQLAKAEIQRMIGTTVGTGTEYRESSKAANPWDPMMKMQHMLTSGLDLNQLEQYMQMQYQEFYQHQAVPPAAAVAQGAGAAGMPGMGGMQGAQGGAMEGAGNAQMGSALPGSMGGMNAMNAMGGMNAMGAMGAMNPMNAMNPMGGMGAPSGVESAKEAKGETTQKAEEEAPPGFDDDEAPPGL